MNIDKTKFIRYLSFTVLILGVVNKILAHYSLFVIPDAELDFWSGIIVVVAAAVFGVSIDANVLKSIFKGKSGGL